MPARIVVLAASACESARILLNSKSSKFPQGLANSSGTVGRYLTDSTGASVSGFIPKLMDWMPHNEDGIQGAHLYIPWWVDNKKLDFPRGYHVELGGGRRMPSAGFRRQHPAVQRHARRPRDRRLRRAAEERLPPLLRRDGQLRRPRRDDSERRQLLRDRSEHGRQVRASRCCASASSGATTKSSRRSTCRRPSAPSSQEMGGTPLGNMPSREPGYGLATGGRIIHEIGTTRMGNDPSTSVLNRNCQAHDVKNVFVDRRRSVRDAVRQESDLDDSRARDGGRASSSPNERKKGSL